MRILGIDPGSRITGWGVVEADGWDLRYIDCGAVRTASSGAALAPRLHALARGLREVLERHRPEVVAIENVFTAKNARAALVLGHARGACLLVAAEAGLALHEYQPMQVKASVCGYGRADKHQVRQALVTQLALREPPTPLDASDALAIACCHAGAARLEARLARVPAGPTA